MTLVSNSLTKLLDQELTSVEDVEQFIDNLEDEIFGISNRNFYLKYKGDIKELLDSNINGDDPLGFEGELLQAFLIYSKQRMDLPN